MFLGGYLPDVESMSVTKSFPLMFHEKLDRHMQQPFIFIVSPLVPFMVDQVRCLCVSECPYTRCYKKTFIASSYELDCENAANFLCHSPASPYKTLHAAYVYNSGERVGADRSLSALDSRACLRF